MTDIIEFNQYGAIQIYAILAYWTCHFIILIYKICIKVMDQIMKMIEAKKLE